MPPTTEAGLDADRALDDKLGAFFESEAAAEAAEEAPVEAETPADTAEPEATAENGDETPVTPASEQETDDPDVAAVLQKYGGDTNKALKALMEAQSLIGRQGQELGELRRDFQAQLAGLQQQTQQQQVASQAPAAIETLLDQGNYQAAAEWARQSQNGVLYNHVMSQWHADPEQAYFASQYTAAVQAMVVQQQIDQKLDERFAGIEQATQPLLANHAQSSFERDLAVFSSDKPDINTVAPEMVRVAEEYEAAVRVMLTDPNPEQRQKGFDFMYTIARGRIGDTLAQAATQADQAAQEAAAAAKTAATVGSSSTTSQTKPSTAVEKAKAEFRAILFDDPSSIQKGLVRGQ